MTTQTVPCIWFGAAEPTHDHTRLLRLAGFELCAIREGRGLAVVPLETPADLRAVITALLGLAAGQRAEAIAAASWPSPLAYVAHHTAQDALRLGTLTPFDHHSGQGNLPVLAWWAGRGWVPVGHLNQAACRWLLSS